jgi:hypothetical protein
MYKGNLSNHSIQVREIGGEVDQTGLQIAGAARFSSGEEVVLFLSGPNSDQSYSINGMMMGKYNIDRDANGTEILSGAGVNPMTDPHTITKAQTGPSAPDSVIQTSKKWTVNALKDEIKRQENSLVGDENLQEHSNVKSQESKKIQISKGSALSLQSNLSVRPLSKADRELTENEPSSQVMSDFILKGISLILIIMAVVWWRMRH